MTKEPKIDCEYCIVLGNENKCKALQIETHTCLGITAKNKCPIYKIKQQLQKYRSALEEIREDMEQDTTCESRECGCDDYAECLNCIKETILNKISEVINE